MSNWRKVESAWINFDNLLDIFIDLYGYDKEGEIYYIYFYHPSCETKTFLFKQRFFSFDEAQRFLDDFMNRAC